jgi:DNA-binding transcriptional LysR family regulator
MFDGDLLKTFSTVADCGGFTRAAELLNMSQSAVSVHIRRLEAQIGVPLLKRTTRSVALTRDGETLLGYARTILSLQDEARARLKPRSTAKGRVRIGTSEDFAEGALPNVLRTFGIRHPNVMVEVEVGITADLLTALDEAEFDLVLGKQCAQIPDDRGEVLWQERLVWAFAAQLRLPQDSSLPLAFFPEPCAYRDAAMKALVGWERRWRVALVSPSIAGVRAAALAGFAATPLNVGMLGEQLREVMPEEGLPELPDVRFMMFVRGREAKEGNLARQFTDIIRECAASMRFNL